MSAGRGVSGLLEPVERAASPEAGLAAALPRLVALGGARAGALVWAPDAGAPLIAVAGARRGSRLDGWLRARLAEPGRASGATALREPPPGWRGAGAALVRLPLGPAARARGRLVLVGAAGSRGLRAGRIPADLPARLGVALAQLWRRHQHAREARALLEAGRAVNRSLDVAETMRVILEQARAVLGVTACALFTLDAATGDLSAVANLDPEPLPAGGLRVRVGEGVTGRAVAERRPRQSADLWNDPAVRYPDVPRERGLRSMLAAPLVVGGEAIGALTLLRRDVHRFGPEEEALAVLFAEQAATALEHARLFSSVRGYSARLEAMVAARTRELDAEKRFVEVVLETLPLGLYVLDADLAVVTANREGTALLGAARPGRAFLDLLPPAAAGAARDLLRAARAAGAVTRAEQELADAAGPRVVRLTAAPLAAASAHLVVLVEDVTRAKQLERQMLLTERLTTVGRLVSGVAHELNNPLATIAGCAEALRERAGDPSLKDLPAFADFPPYLGLIEEEAYRCKDVTGSLLQLVRDPGTRRAATLVNATVTRTLELLRHQSRFAGSRMETALDPELPPVIANEAQLRQVLLGLAANALEAMEGRGTLTIRTRRHGDAEIAIEVADEGPGIPADILPRVFDPFFTTKAPGQGTGLGLAIAQGLVSDHGGRLEVASPPGAGATFRILLPLG